MTIKAKSYQLIYIPQTGEKVSRKNYENYLKTKWWTKIIRKNIERHPKFTGLCDNLNCCYTLGKLRTYSIHHLNYNCLGNERYLKDIVILCYPCHQDVHDKPHTFPNLLFKKEIVLRSESSSKFQKEKQNNFF